MAVVDDPRYTFWEEHFSGKQRSLAHISPFQDLQEFRNFFFFLLSRSLTLSLSLKSVVSLLPSASAVVFKQTVNRL